MSLILLLALASAPPLPQDDTRKAFDLLKDASDAWKGWSSIRIEGRSTTTNDYPGREIALKRKFVLTMKRPGSIRLEMKSPLLEELFVVHGKTGLLWSPTGNLYAALGKDPAGIVSSTIGPAVSLFLESDPWMNHPSKEQAGESGITVRKKMLNDAECDVLEFSLVKEFRFTFWIDRKHALRRFEIYADLNKVATRTVFDYEKVEKNPAVPDDSFKFTPPPGAKKLDDVDDSEK